MNDILVFIGVLLSGLIGIYSLLSLFGIRVPVLSRGRSTSLNKVISAQNSLGSRLEGKNIFGPSEKLITSIESSGSAKKRTHRLTIQKRLKYACWGMSPVIFHTLEIGLSLVTYFLVSLKCGVPLQVASLFTGPLFLRWLLNFCVDRRFQRFDKDYPQFLMSVVGLLKTGMTSIAALEASARGLEHDSIVREEVELMIDRLRMGVAEERSIGSFGETIYHPEIELFVQALILSRRIGGSLSDTLERLAKQVRKRQYFRSSAVAAVGMQRGSVWVIIGILVGLQVYLGIMYPDLVFKALETDTGWQVWQVCVLMIGLGVFWVRQVTKMKI